MAAVTSTILKCYDLHRIGLFGQLLMSVPLHASEFGNPENPPLLILHGLFGSSANWRSIALRLSDHFRTFALDLRNHGRSPWRDSMTYHDLADDLADFISSRELDSPHLVGHSMGGKTIMVLLQNRQFTVGKAVVIDIAPVSYAHDHEHLIDALHAIDLDKLDSRRQADELLAPAIPDTPLRQFLLQNLVRRNGRFSWRINLDSIKGNGLSLYGYPDDAPAYSDILFIRGEKSDYILSESDVKKAFPNSSLKTVKGAGHWLHSEQPDALLDLLRDHLDVCSPRE